MRKYSRHLQVILRALFIVCVAIGAALVPMTILILLGYVGLLDLTTIVSVGVTDLAVSFVLYYIFGHGHPSREEKVVNQMDAAQKLSHLNVYTFPILKIKQCYVENTTTKECYKAPDFIADMTEDRLIFEIPCKNEKEMKDRLANNNVHLNEKTEATIMQLMPKTDQPKASEKVINKDVV